MFTRIIEKEIEKYLQDERILLLLWARQVWKTTIIKNLQKKLDQKWELNFYINLENPEFLEILNSHPENIFQIIWKNDKKIVVFIDEIQYLKNPSNFLKYIYDEYKGQIKLIVSGSSAFYIDTNFTDSLSGRKKIFYIQSLSFEEFLIFKGKDFFLDYLNKEEIPLVIKRDFENYYYEYITFWWYPAVVLATTIAEKKELLQEIGLSYIKKDILEAWVKNEEKYYFILKILASQVGSLLNINEISNTINLPVSTVEKYIYIMKKSFHIATILPFYKNIRKELTKMPKIYFYDVGLRNFFINNFENFDFRVDKWELFENVVFKKLLEKYELQDIKFWRTQNKNEVDFILEKDKIAYEVKVRKDKFNPKKYKLFTENYSDFSLKVLDFERSMKNIL